MVWDPLKQKKNLMHARGQQQTKIAYKILNLKDLQKKKKISRFVKIYSDLLIFKIYRLQAF